MLNEPCFQFMETSRRVREDLVFELASHLEQADVELQLGDVNTESG